MEEIIKKILEKRGGVALLKIQFPGLMAKLVRAVRVEPGGVLVTRNANGDEVFESIGAIITLVDVTESSGHVAAFAKEEAPNA